MKKLTVYASMIMLFAALFFTPACGDDDECVTEAMSYKNDILPILKDKGCTASSCHNGSNPALGDLNGYATLKVLADANRLLGAIKHEANFSAMPKGGSKMGDCEISKIEAWVNQGKKDN
jgi:hypothetical protein